MEKWNRNNRACKTTWSTLKVLHQLVDKFETAGSIKMDELTFWNTSATPELRTIQANTLAFQIDNIFRMIRRSKFEDGTTHEEAITDMVKCLLNKNKTVADFAELNDFYYLFWGEDDDL
ncbi:MAG: hypothetical protein K8H86_05750 [Ignavibacteriaceae bacterium]|nr:hypothetical protein [Ignavibacteriaceae bacterium]